MSPPDRVTAHDDRQYVAIDLGSGSGRVVVGRFGSRTLDLELVHRFPNVPHRVDGHERWDVTALFDGIKEGLRRLPDKGRSVASIGVDTWGVDYGLLDAHGRLLEDPICYRDARTEGASERVFSRIGREELFAIAGLQTLPFNTIYQLEAQHHAGEWPEDAVRLLMLPDLFHHVLCGSDTGEVTIASTTELLSARTRHWDVSLFARLGLPLDVMPRLVPPGTRLGTLTPALQAELGLPAVPIVTPAAHDTASAVVGAPLEPGWAFLSSGTWSLLGTERPEPLLTEAVQQAEFTNELGAEQTTRLLKNSIGLWVLESCRAIWADRGAPIDHETLMQRLGRAAPFQGIVCLDDPRFFQPIDMVEEIRSFLRETGQQVPEDPGAIARIVLESLALRYADVLATLARITAQPARGVRVVGGGARNEFLNQATADAARLEVRAGPIEATALGNAMIQAIADGRFGGVAEARAYVASRVGEATYRPTNQTGWTAARERFAVIAKRRG